MIDKCNFVIREMKREDCKAVAAIEERSFSKPWTADDFERLFVFSNYHYFVAVCENHMIAFGGISCSFEDCDLMNIAVLPEYRGQHISTAMLKKLKQCAIDHLCEVMHLEVRKSNETAKALYTSYGFYPIGERRGYYQEPVEDAIIMDCQLKDSQE